MTTILYINCFKTSARCYLLALPVTIVLDYEDGVWCYSNEALNISGYAEKEEDALRNLHECFDFAYRDIAEADDNELNSKAILLKQHLLSIVADIESA